jgi:hypothetical protein
MTITKPKPATPKPKRPWFQFSLRTLLVFVTLVSVLCSIATYIGWGFIWNSIWGPLCSIGTAIGWSIPLAVLILMAVVGVIAYTRSVEVVRLLAAVVIALASCIFVAAYNGYAETRFPFDHPGETLTARPVIGEFVAVHGKHAYVVPVAGLLLGTLVIWRWPTSHVLIELVVLVLWILAFIWAGVVLIVWQVQNIPIFTHMQFHY